MRPSHRHRDVDAETCHKLWEQRAPNVVGRLAGGLVTCPRYSSHRGAPHTITMLVSNQRPDGWASRFLLSVTQQMPVAPRTDAEGDESIIPMGNAHVCPCSQGPPAAQLTSRAARL